MLSRIQPQGLERLTVRELEDLLERKRRNQTLGDLLRERDRLRSELRSLEKSIDLYERTGEASRSQVNGDDREGTSRKGIHAQDGRRRDGRRSGSTDGAEDGASALEIDGADSEAYDGDAMALGERCGGAYADHEDDGLDADGGFDDEQEGGPRGNVARASYDRSRLERNGDAALRRLKGENGRQSFLAGKRRRNLKDYIAQVLLDAGESLSPSDIQRRLPEAGYTSSSTNPRSFYNTVFQALQRYDIFEKDNRKYRLAANAIKVNGVKEILPKKKTRLKDYIVEVLDKAEAPLKVSEIASRVVIAGYDTDLGMDELSQRVSATLKKYLNRDFDWDSQRYRLATRN